MQLKIGYLFQCPPWARSFCPFRACCLRLACVLLAFILRAACVYPACCLRLSCVLLAFILRAASGTSALYLCFTLRPAIFNSLRPVTVGSGHLAAIIWTYDTPFFLYAPGSPRYSKIVDTWRGGKYWLCSW